MHVIIIAFGAVHAARRESFAVYAVVYAIYFFPWRLLRRRADTGLSPVMVQGA
jgi:hypothetical protein